MDAAAHPALTPREVPARTIPVPSTISPALQRSIAAAALLPRDVLLRSPTSDEQWRGMAAANNAISLERQEGVKVKFPSKDRRARGRRRPGPPGRFAGGTIRPTPRVS